MAQITMKSKKTGKTKDYNVNDNVFNFAVCWCVASGINTAFSLVKNVVKAVSKRI